MGAATILFGHHTFHLANKVERCLGDVNVKLFAQVEDDGPLGDILMTDGGAFLFKDWH